MTVESHTQLIVIQFRLVSNASEVLLFVSLADRVLIVADIESF